MMMMNSTLNRQFKLSSGTVINGKWHGNQYEIVKELGSGATGIVYLAIKNSKDYVALKISYDNLSTTSEVNILKSLGKVQSLSFGPSLLDVDDWVRSSSKDSFYAMEYISGSDLLTFLNNGKQEWLVVFILQLLNDLQKLHNNGWVFGDLKPENLIISGPPPIVRCIDVGGVTLQGRAIKEYTEFFDRGYWGLGTRKAEPSYDLFAVAMIMINTAYPKRFTKKENNLDLLILSVQNSDLLMPYGHIIVNALKGKYKEAADMRTDLLKSVKKDNAIKYRSNVNHTISRKRTNSSKSPAKKKGHIIETTIILSLIVVIYFLYVYSNFIL